MKRIIISLALFSIAYCTEIQPFSLDCRAVKIQEKKGSTWFICPLHNSFEQKILSDMAKEDRFSVLRSWQAPTLKIFRQAILDAGFRIVGHEVRREIITGSVQDWIEKEIDEWFDVDPVLKYQIVQEFLNRVQSPFGIPTRMLVVTHPQ